MPGRADGNKLRLHGFNNLTKTLSFSIYDICYACSDLELRSYFEYIDQQYNSERLTQILHEVTAIIGANVLHVAKADYEPHGASVTMMVSEGGTVPAGLTRDPSPGPRTLVAHLDKSHLTVHTYPESHPSLGISTFRADIDVSTCGHISPLKALNFLIHSFDSDIVYIDYRVRGFTRDTDGRKHYIDHEMRSIRDYLDQVTRDCYRMADTNRHREKIFHTRLICRDFDLEEYLFNINPSGLEPAYREKVERCLRREMQEIFEGRNLS